jgi:hypothetical protein
MTKTTYILTASALALIANTASAFDFYGSFANHEKVTAGDSRGAATLSRGDSMSRTWTSLDALTEGNPDSSVHPMTGYARRMDPTAPRITSLEVLTAGNPDSAVHSILGSGSERPVVGIAASARRLDRGGV